MRKPIAKIAPSRWLAAAVLLCSGLLGGCATTKLYRSERDLNLRVARNVRIGSLFSGMVTTLQIYRTAAACRTTYLGLVRLNRAVTKIGLPTGQRLLVLVDFSRFGLFSQVGNMSDEATLELRPGYRYRLDVRYVGDIYGLALFAKAPMRGARWQRLRQDSAGRCHIANGTEWG